MAKDWTNDNEQIAGSFILEEANTSPSSLQDVAMKFLVHAGGKFGGGTNGCCGGRVCSMTFMEPDGVDWFVMLDNLVHHGYRGNASLYYLKLGFVPPEGLVLMEGIEQFHQLMNDYEGKKVCNLYIVKQPKVSSATRDKNPNTYVHDNSSDSEDNMDDGYAWEGEEEDDELYVIKTNDDSNWKHKQQGQPSEKSRTNTNDDSNNVTPIEYAHSPLHSNEDETVYVQRSLGVDYVRFDESTMRHPIMDVGTVFTNVKQFREALKNLIICEGRDVRRPKNDLVKVSAKCNTNDCPWSEKDWRVKSLRDAVLRDTQVGISKTKAYRAKRYAVQKIGGDYYEQYRMIQDYAHIVLSINPGSSIVIKCFTDPIQMINPRFERMYVSFDAQVKGFLAGCRPFIGLDGTHVKLTNGGQILTAQGRDTNNNLFPIAFALVEADNGYAWTWFLELLVQSIGHGEHCGGWTIMSDRQKGLKDGVKVVFPREEHRYYLRHLYANFSRARFKGLRLKQLMDNAAYAYKGYDFNQAMDEIKKENSKAWKWLSDIDSKHWSRHRFTPNTKTDLVVNNISESYNAWILEEREEPLSTMVEHIRTKLMESISIKREGAEKDT